MKGDGQVGVWVRRRKKTKALSVHPMGLPRPWAHPSLISSGAARYDPAGTGSSRAKPAREPHLLLPHREDAPAWQCPSGGSKGTIRLGAEPCPPLRFGLYPG